MGASPQESQSTGAGNIRQGAHVDSTVSVFPVYRPTWLRWVASRAATIVS